MWLTRPRAETVAAASRRNLIRVWHFRQIGGNLKVPYSRSPCPSPPSRENALLHTLYPVKPFRQKCPPLRTICLARDRFILLSGQLNGRARARDKSTTGLRSDGGRKTRRYWKMGGKKNRIFCFLYIFLRLRPGLGFMREHSDRDARRIDRFFLPFHDDSTVT